MNGAASKYTYFFIVLLPSLEYERAFYSVALASAFFYYVAS